jgi:hypothetical protein
MTSRKSRVSFLQNVKNGGTSGTAMTLRSPVRDFDHSTFVLTCSVSVKERLRVRGWKLSQCQIALHLSALAALQIAGSCAMRHSG